MLFLHSGPVTGTHGLFMLAAALADSHAPQTGVRETVSVLQKMKMRIHLRRVIVRAQPQVLIDMPGVDHLSRIHLPLGIPDVFEFPEGFDELMAEHFVEELGLGLSIAVL